VEALPHRHDQALMDLGFIPPDASPGGEI